MNKADALAQLHESRLLRDQAQADLFREASEALLELPPDEFHTRELDQLYACFDDGAVLGDLAWDVLQLVEGSDDDCAGLLRAAAGLATAAPAWFEILLRRTLNDTATRASLFEAVKTVDEETKRLVAVVATRISQRTGDGAAFGGLLLQVLQGS